MRSCSAERRPAADCREACFDDLARIGATDIPVEGRAEDVAVDRAEANHLLAALNRSFDAALTPAEMVANPSGVRALDDDDAARGAWAATRDWVFDVDGGEGRAPILSAFGGEITTCRDLAEHGLERPAPFFPAMGGPRTATAPCPAAPRRGGFRPLAGGLPRRAALAA
jgi:glycerol-3-phosphate dehydrogenase